MKSPRVLKYSLALTPCPSKSVNQLIVSIFIIMDNAAILVLTFLNSPELFPLVIIDSITSKNAAYTFCSYHENHHLSAP